MDKTYYIVKVHRDIMAFEILEIIKSFDMKWAKRIAVDKYRNEIQDGKMEITVITKQTYRAAFDHGLIVNKDGKALTVGRNL